VEELLCILHTLIQVHRDLTHIQTSVRFSTLFSLVQVLHWNQRVLLSEYIKPHFPNDVYKYNMHHGDAAHKVAHEHDRTVAIWLEGVNPSIPTPIALGVVDTQRYACL